MSSALIAPINAMTCLVGAADVASACDAACEVARKAANPLADTKAIITDNTIASRTGTDDDPLWRLGDASLWANRAK